MVGQGTVLDVDNDSLIVVTMEYGAPCEHSKLQVSAGTYTTDDSCHSQAVTIDTGVLDAIH